MKNKNNYDYLLADLTKLNGVGKKTMEILKKKKVNNIFDLLWRLPKSYTCLLYTSPSPRDPVSSRMPSSA